MGGCLIACEGGTHLWEDALSLAKEGPACGRMPYRLREDALLHVVRRDPFMGRCLTTCSEGNPICERMPYHLW